MITQAPRGTYDLYGKEIQKWHYVENEIAKLMKAFHFTEVRTPIFEHTELFARGVGDTTDIVQKEMYTFEDKGGRSITLKPEGTAGAARAFLEHKMYADPQPTKLYYVTNCFRYEKPQAGRDRQFTQFGIELYGSDSAYADAEAMSVAYTLLCKLGVTNVTLHINSLGCSNCRGAYNAKLKAYLESRKEGLCDTCKGRLERNPLRILDCKDPDCKKIVADAPSILDSLDEECKAHFEQLQQILTDMQIPFVVDPGIVRGLDYYTRTVFEFVCNEIGAQGTVCAGGRYDHLVEELGGDPCPAVGFGLGIGRCILAMEAVGHDFGEEAPVDLYIGSMGETARRKSSVLTMQLRGLGFCVENDLVGRSVKAQMKYANKLGARYSIILGDSELESGRAQLKNMTDSTSAEIDFNDLENWKGLLK